MFTPPMFPSPAVELGLAMTATRQGLESAICQVLMMQESVQESSDTGAPSLTVVDHPLVSETRQNLPQHMVAPPPPGLESLAQSCHGSLAEVKMPA